jgi:hypothetical protein
MSRRRLLWFLAAITLLPGTATAAAKPPVKSVYKVPGNIKSDCSSAVENKLMAWLATVPDGATVQFPSNGCYGQDGTITLTGRNRLVIDGGGSEFRALTPGGSSRANWRFVGGSELTMQNVAVRGANPQGVYDHTVEWQHGFSIEGVQGMTLTNVQARETWGDGIYVGHSTNTPACGDDASSSRNVVITGATLERAGRQGLAITDAEQVTLQNSTVGPVAWSGVDVEPDATCDIARHITISHNSFGANHYGVFGSFGFGADPQVGDVTVTDNVQTAPTGSPGECYSPVVVYSPDGVYRKGYTFSGNSFMARRYGFGFRRVREAQISSNTVTFDPASGASCGTTTGVFLVDSHTIGITGNVFRGAASVFTADALSTDITEQGNSTT